MKEDLFIEEHNRRAESFRKDAEIYKRRYPLCTKWNCISYLARVYDMMYMDVTMCVNIIDSVFENM